MCIWHLYNNDISEHSQAYPNLHLSVSWSHHHQILWESVVRHYFRQRCWWQMALRSLGKQSSWEILKTVLDIIVKTYTHFLAKSFSFKYLRWIDLLASQWVKLISIQNFESVSYLIWLFKSTTAKMFEDKKILDNWPILSPLDGKIDFGMFRGTAAWMDDLHKSINNNLRSFFACWKWSKKRHLL